MQSTQSFYQQKVLESLAQANSYNEWLIKKIENYLGSNILELGSGLGSITLKIKDKGFNILPSDIDRSFLKILKKIDKKAIYLDVLNIKLGKKFDTIIAINVLEHLDDDLQSLKNIFNLLTTQGILILLVPAHQFLFGSYDKMVGHFRRYSKKDLSKLLLKTGFRIQKINYHNKLAALGWFINAKLLKRKDFPKYQLYLVNWLVPLLDLFDKVIPFNFGLSIICVARKK